MREKTKGIAAGLGLALAMLLVSVVCAVAFAAAAWWVSGLGTLWIWLLAGPVAMLGGGAVGGIIWVIILLSAALRKGN